MRGAIPPPQYAFIAWCSVKTNTGTNLHLPYEKIGYKLFKNLKCNLSMLGEG
jgi:hypothetical protein